MQRELKFAVEKYVLDLPDNEKYVFCWLNNVQIIFYLNHDWEWDYISTYYSLNRDLQSEIDYDLFRTVFSRMLIRQPIPIEAFDTKSEENI